MANFENTILKVRGDNATNWSTNNPVLDNRELALDLTENEIRIGNGSRWNNTNKFIANNAAVKAAAQAASTAQSTATSANQTAQTAYNMAQQALNAGGRRMEIGENIEGYPSLTIDNEFVDKYANYNIDCLVSLDSATFNFDTIDRKTDLANDIIFNFYTAGNCTLKGSNFTATFGDIDTPNNYILLVDVNSILQVGEGGDEFVIPADHLYRMIFHDTWMLKIEAYSLALPQ